MGIKKRSIKNIRYPLRLTQSIYTISVYLVEKLTKIYLKIFNNKYEVKFRYATSKYGL